MATPRSLVSGGSQLTLVKAFVIYSIKFIEISAYVLVASWYYIQRYIYWDFGICISCQLIVELECSWFYAINMVSLTWKMLFYFIFWVVIWCRHVKGFLLRNKLLSVLWVILFGVKQDMPVIGKDQCLRKYFTKEITCQHVIMHITYWQVQRAI